MTAAVYDRDTLIEAAAAVFVGAGLSPPAARTVAESLVAADARGIPSHGLMLVPMYVDRLRAGSVSTRESANVVVDFGAVAVLDAQHALGQLTADQAMALCIEKAHQFGIGAVAVRHAFHFGGAFRYVEQAAAAGCIGVAMANTRPLMPATGGATPVVGNNPVAIGVPRPEHPPLILDMALSEAALGKIRLAAAEQRAIPPTWATDADGTPTTDPAAAIAGMLLPIGGPKGYGLALMVDVLTGVLSGGGFGSHVQGMYADTSRPNDCSHFFLALDAAAFDQQHGQQVGARVAELIAQIRASRPTPGVAQIYLPGEREQLKAAEPTVSLDHSVVAGLGAAAAAVGVALGSLPEAIRA